MRTITYNNKLYTIKDEVFKILKTVKDMSINEIDKYLVDNMSDWEFVKNCNDVPNSIGMYNSIVSDYISRKNIYTEQQEWVMETTIKLFVISRSMIEEIMILGYKFKIGVSFTIDDIIEATYEDFDELRYDNVVCDIIEIMSQINLDSKLYIFHLNKVDRYVVIHKNKIWKNNVPIIKIYVPEKLKGLTIGKNGKNLKRIIEDIKFDFNTTKTIYIKVRGDDGR